MLLNQFKTALVFLHRFKLSLLAMLVLIRSRILLLIFPISDLEGFRRRHVGLLAKLGLWSLRVMKASRLAVMFIRSSSSSFSAMHLASFSMGLVVFGVTFSPQT